MAKPDFIELPGCEPDARVRFVAWGSRVWREKHASDWFQPRRI